MDQIELLKEKLNDVRTQLLAHPVHTSINEIENLVHFTQFHVFAVWDFMSLLKSLQMNLTGVIIPWRPVGSAGARFLINEIVLGEESDTDQFGNRTSHFELYLSAMKQMNASTHLIDRLFENLQEGQTVEKAIDRADLPSAIKDFLNFTFDIIRHHPVHVQAAVFTFGREDLIPEMFMQILDKLYSSHPEKISIFKYYIERHIEVDGGHHSHLALEMVRQLCGTDQKKWEEATYASVRALEHRIRLWDGVVAPATC